MTLDDRNKMIEETVNDVDNWDFESLVSYLKDLETEMYSHMSPDVLQQAYNDWKETNE